MAAGLSGCSRPPPQQQCFSAPPGGLQGVPMPAGYVIPLGPRAETPLRESDLEATDQVPKPLQFAPFNSKKQWLYCELPREFLALSLGPSTATLQRNLI